MAALPPDVVTNLERENARLQAELRTARDRQKASAEILRAISEVSGNAERSLTHIAEITARLFGASSVVLRIAGDGTWTQTIAVGAGAERIVSEVSAGLLRIGARNLPGPVGLENRQIHVPDIHNVDPAFADWPGLPPARAAGTRVMAGTPLRRDGTTIGVLTVHRDRPVPFTEEELALQQSFADQAVIAIENSRLFNETREALERQTATSDILKVIASSPSDVQPVFDAIVNSAATLFEPWSATITTLRDGKLHWNAIAARLPGFDHERAKAVYPIPFDPERSPSARAMLERRIIEIPDTTAPDTPEYTRKVGAAGGLRNATFVPLVHEGNGIGTIILTHPQAGVRLSEKQLALVQTFADQAVIAIQNVRLFNETQEALEQQTATSEVLTVISNSSGDLPKVFDAMLDKAMHLCGAEFGVLATYNGNVFQTAATRGLPENYAAFRARSSGDYGPATAPIRLLQGEPLVHIVDLTVSEAYRAGEPNRRALVDLGGARSLLCVPLLNDRRVIGCVMIFRQESRPFTDRQIALLEHFAAQAVIGIENTRLLNELRARTDDLSESLQQQTATADVLKVISRSAFDLDAVFRNLIETAARLCDAATCIVFRREGAVLLPVAGVGVTDEFMGFMRAQPMTIDRGTISGRAALERVTVHVPDIDADPEFKLRAAPLIGGWRSILAVPLLRDGEPVGILALARPIAGPFTQRQIELIETFADQAVIAIENVRLFQQVQTRTQELTRSLEDLRAAQDRLVQTEKLASLGQLTAGIAHEIKNPLNFVNNFAALSAELTDELNEVLKPAALEGNIRQEVDELTHMLKDNLEKVVQHGKRADSIVKNMLLHSREGSGEHRPADINALLDESLNLAYHGAHAEKPQFNVTLQRDFDDKAGMIELFPQEITRVFLNLIANGFYAVSKRKAENGSSGFEPVLSASTRNLGNTVEIRIRDNGTGIPAEVREKMFNPFFTTKPAGEGTGLGLSMSHDIVVKQHGGTIDVETEPGQFTEFRIILPRTSNSPNKIRGQT